MIKQNKKTTKDITEESLKELYLYKNWRQKELADFYNCSISTIKIHLRKYSIGKEVKLSADNVEKEIQEYNPHAKLINFTKTQEPLTIKCSCGESFTRRIDTIRKYKSCLCVKCSGYRGPANPLTFKEVVGYIESYDCKLLSDFKGVESKITIRCKCSNIFTTTFTIFRQGNNHACTECYHRRHAREQALSKEEVNQVIESNGCRWISGDYKNLKSKLMISCLECESPYEVSLDKFLYEHQVRCRKCSKRSSGYEIYLDTFLKSNDVTFSHDKHLEGAYGTKGGKLRFDFIIQKENGQRVIIEVDGAQHYRNGGNKDYFNDKQSFKERKENDRLKEEYCSKHKIPLMRISYKMFHSNKRKQQMEKEVLAFVNDKNLSSLHHLEPIPQAS